MIDIKRGRQYPDMKGFDFMKRKNIKRKIFVVNTKENEKKVVFMTNEEEECKLYCEIFGYTYRVDYINLGY